jgi:hypothetical protein
MVRSKDVKSKVARGRVFPLPFSAVAHRCKELKVCDTHGARVTIRFVNLKGEPDNGDEVPLAEFHRQGKLEVYSVADEIDPDRASAALEQAPREFAVPKKKRRGPFGSCYETHLACLVQGRGVKFYHVIYHLQSRKYRTGSKFSNAFKRRLVRAEFRPLKPSGRCRG